MRIALLGTRGAPAQYGGFETAVEEIGSRLARRGHDVMVYCRNPGQTLKTYRGMRLLNIPAVRRRQFETLSHSFLSSLDLLRRSADVAVVFNAANAPVIPLIRVPKAIHVDGIEWRRDKWRGRAAAYLRWSERMSVHLADAVIADARGIQHYLTSQYGVPSVFIPYGAPVIRRESISPPVSGEVEARRFHLVVARLEPENSLDMILDGYIATGSEIPLVVIGDNPYPTPYVESLRARLRSRNVCWRGALWDQNELDWYYANCLTYIHGHTVGGTNPSLLRAMGAGAAVLAREGIFNREVAGDKAAFFATAESLASLLEQFEASPSLRESTGEDLRCRAAERYSWDSVAAAYEELCANLVGSP